MSSRALDIAFVTIADLPEGGGNTARLRALVDALARSGHRVRIWNEHALGVSPAGAQRARGWLGPAAYAYALGTTKRGAGVAALPTKLRAVAAIAHRLHAARRAGQADVVWFNGLSLYDTAPLTWLARRLGAATVQSYEDERLEVVSDAPISLSRRLFAVNSRLADRLCPPLADALVVISSYLREKYARLCGREDRLHLVPTIVDCEAWSLPPEPEGGEALLLYCGAFGEQDAVEETLDAFALLRSYGRRFRAVLLGSHERHPERVAALRERIARAGLADRVEMPGFVPTGEVREWITRANVLLGVRRDGVWSRSGLSTKLSEYLASGRMVITSDVGDTARYLRHGESAMVVPGVARPADIARVIGQGLESAALRRRIGAAGREVARRCFDVPVARRALDGVLVQAPGRGPAASRRAPVRAAGRAALPPDTRQDR